MAEQPRDERRLRAVSAHEPGRCDDLARACARPRSDEGQGPGDGCRNLARREATGHRGVDAVLGHPPEGREFPSYHRQHTLGGLQDRVATREVAGLGIDTVLIRGGEQGAKAREGCDHV